MRVAARFLNAAVQSTETAIRKVPDFLFLDVSIARHWLEALSFEPAESRYMAQGEIPAVGPARLVFGTYQGVTNPTPSPAGMNYLSVTLKQGQTWTYKPPQGHDVGWIYVHQRKASVSGESAQDELAIFEECLD
jgi:redox-sensitive bicupin YhaK (pirin superfamily)